MYYLHEISPYCLVDDVGVSVATAEEVLAEEDDARAEYGKVRRAVEEDECE